MPIGTVYDPDKTDDFSKKGLTFNGQGMIGNCPAGVATNIDYKLADDCDFNGVQYLIQGGAFGDSVNLQVLDRDGVYYPAGTLLSQFATNWYVNLDGAGPPITIPYPAKLNAGLVIRAVYNSVGAAAVNIALNLQLHKVKF